MHVRILFALALVSLPLNAEKPPLGDLQKKAQLRLTTQQRENARARSTFEDKAAMSEHDLKVNHYLPYLEAAESKGFYIVSGYPECIVQKGDLYFFLDWSGKWVRLYADSERRFHVGHPKGPLEPGISDYLTTHLLNIERLEREAKEREERAETQRLEELRMLTRRDSTGLRFKSSRTFHTGFGQDSIDIQSGYPRRTYYGDVPPAILGVPECSKIDTHKCCIHFKNPSKDKTWLLGAFEADVEMSLFIQDGYKKLSLAPRTEDKNWKLICSVEEGSSFKWLFDHYGMSLYEVPLSSVASNGFRLTPRHDHLEHLPEGTTFQLRTDLLVPTRPARSRMVERGGVTCNIGVEVTNDWLPLPVNTVFHLGEATIHYEESGKTYRFPVTGVRGVQALECHVRRGYITTQDAQTALESIGTFVTPDGRTFYVHRNESDAQGRPGRWAETTSFLQKPMKKFPVSVMPNGATLTLRSGVIPISERGTVVFSSGKTPVVCFAHISTKDRPSKQIDSLKLTVRSNGWFAPNQFTMDTGSEFMSIICYKGRSETVTIEEFVESLDPKFHFDL